MNVLELKGLDGVDTNNVANREKITKWVRERRPAFVIGKPCNRSMGHIRFLFGLYKMQVDEGRWFVHEQLEDSATWKMEEV